MNKKRIKKKKESVVPKQLLRKWLLVNWID